MKKGFLSNDEKKQILELFVEQDQSVEEVAAQLDRSVKAVEKYLSSLDESEEEGVAEAKAPPVEPEPEPVVEEKPKKPAVLRDKPASLKGQKRGVHVADRTSSERVDMINQRVAGSKPPMSNGAYKIYKND